MKTYELSEKDVETILQLVDMELEMIADMNAPKEIEEWDDATHRRLGRLTSIAEALDR